MDIHDADGMGAFRMRLLAVCEELRAAGIVNSLNDWATKAGIPESTIPQFMRGKARSLSLKTYLALAAVADRPFATLMSADAARSDEERLVLDGLRQADQETKEIMVALARRETRGQSQS